MSIFSFRAPFRQRLTVLGLLTGVMVGLFGVAPAAAQPESMAISPNSCSGPGCGPCPQNVTWRQNGPFIFAYEYTIHSATPTFYVSDARQVSNGLDTPVTVTLTSLVSRTFSVTTTVGFAADLTTTLRTNVSVAIVQSTTTAIGVNVQATVPPFGAVLGEYGVHGYSVTYDATPYITTPDDFRNNVCGRSATRHGLTTEAPTYIEGWRISAV
jgi:hypothetical protein